MWYIFTIFMFSLAPAYETDICLMTVVLCFCGYQWAKCLCSTLALSLGGVPWQWPWTLLRINTRVLGDVLHTVIFPFFVFIFIEYINLVVQRCIQSLIKHRRQSFFVKSVNGSWSLTVFAKHLLLRCLSSECTFEVF